MAELNNHRITKTMKPKLEIYLASVQAAAGALGKAPDEIAAIKKQLAADCGIATAQDFNVLAGLFNEALNAVTQHASEKMPSEIAAQPFTP